MVIHGTFCCTQESVCAADLVQLDATSASLSPNPKDWKCQNCGATKNLWFNLSDGYIGCGRGQVDPETLQHNGFCNFTKSTNFALIDKNP